MDTHLQAVTYRRQLAPDSRLFGCDDACLSQRYTGIGCADCSEACPAGVLKVGAAGFDLAPGCLDCGRCAAACPTHALQLSGMPADYSARRTDVPRIDCERVPAHASPAGALRAPCSGALRTSELLALANASPDGTVEILDRGWCSECSAGGCAHPAAVQVSEAQTLLQTTPGTPARRIVFERRPLPSAARSRDGRDPVLERPLERRGFLRHIVAHAANAMHQVPVATEIGSAPPIDGRARILPAERLAVLRQLQHGNPGQHLHARLLHDIQIGDGCCNQQVCARSCPVAALSHYEEGSARGVAFDAALCIGCGACAANCPEQALRLVPAADPCALPARVRLSRHVQETCLDCGAPFVLRVRHRAENDPLCVACEKSRELGKALFASLFPTTTNVSPREERDGS